MGRPKGSKNKTTKTGPLRKAPTQASKSQAKKPSQKADEQNIPQEVRAKQDSANPFKSPNERLLEAASLLALKGISVEPIIPTQKEFTYKISSRSEKYTPQVEIKVKGTRFWIFGSYLMCSNPEYNHLKNFVNTSNSVEIAKAIIKFARKKKTTESKQSESKQTEHRTDTLTPRSNSHLQLLASCLA